MSSRMTLGRAIAALMAILMGPLVDRAGAQQVLPAPPETVPGRAVVGGPVEGLPQLPPEIQVVRVQAPRGVNIEVVEPAPTPVTVGADALIEGGITVGLQVGVPYQLRLTNLPNQNESEIYPVIELVGHLHRPSTIDASKYPIRVKFTQEDLDEVVEHGRLITHVVYLESPEQALPLKVHRDELLTTELSGAEDPIKVASALGRVMAIVRIGGRTPAPGAGLGLPGLVLEAAPCPFAANSAGGRCGVPCCEDLCPPAPAPTRLTLPSDEFLCDGGDHGAAAGIGPDGRASGVDPKDALVEFRGDGRERLLPTNTVCIYAPRFAAVRLSVGPTITQLVQIPNGAKTVERQVISATRVPPMRLTQNQGAEAARHRARASALNNRIGPEGHIEIRVLTGLDQTQAINGRRVVQTPGSAGMADIAHVAKMTTGPVKLKNAEGTVVTGLVESAGQKIMAWKPQELAAVEVPPNKPGLAVLKQVSVVEAQSGDRVTYTIRYKNIGNVPIRDVSIVDSLLPRLEYVEGSAVGPKGTVFTAAENRVGSVELRWDLPEAVAPNAEGYVRFDAIVR